ncbi:SAM-dependent methyltransferase [candidate division KSB1 bacterium]|nr:MAG: SAM-dependent methyltransferase [candidate division KSB1 bacterium]
MDKSGSNIDFKLMSFCFKIRDFLFPRMNILKEMDIKQGFYLLDYGCGPGSYVVPASRLVGEKGKVYALDINPLAIREVKKIASKKKLINVETIISDCETGLPDSNIDIILLYDTFHDLSTPENVLRGLYRVLKPEGLLSFSDHHLKEDEILNGITGEGLFKLLKKGKKTFTFNKVV